MGQIGDGMQIPVIRPKRAKVKLVDMTHEELVSEYTVAVRFSWAENIRGKIMDPGRSSLYQRELSIKRELLRRLHQNEKT
ncbi:MAG: hypothetical protein WCK48_01125 [bacterium]